MAKHSHFANIKNQKAAQDAKRGKIFTRHAKLIAIAVQKGGADIATNSTLRSAIEKARAQNVPNENIERAIKKGSGELKGQNPIEEVTYEAFGPEGVGIIIECLTDNKNRTVADIRSILNDFGGTLGATGSVSWMFERRGVIEIVTKGNDDEVELAAIDAGALDTTRHDGGITIFTTPESYEHVLNILKKSFPITQSELSLISKNPVEIKSVEKSYKITELIHQIELLDDVSQVFHGASLLNNS